MDDLAKEKKEAIDAGWRALNSLNDLKAELDSARMWGFLDLFGGKTFTGLMKHSKINEASRLATRASYDLELFQREVKDVFPLFDLNVYVGGSLTFFDFFSDGFLVDFLVQNKIEEARDRVYQAIDTVTRLINDLEMA